MFVVAISEYNQVLYEDEKQCRLTEVINSFVENTEFIFQKNQALLEFKKIANDDIFEESGMILFLNKIDLLEDKLKLFPFTGRFDYQGTALLIWMRRGTA